MWQKFTESARRVVLLAQEEAAQMGCTDVGSEHLLLGLLREDEGIAARITQEIGVSVAKLRGEIQNRVERNPFAAPGEPNLNFQAKGVLELAADQARRGPHDQIGIEHLLAALLNEKSCPAIVVLQRLGFDVEAMRSQVLEHLDPQSFVPTMTVSDQIAQDLKAFVGVLNGDHAFSDGFRFVYEARRGYFGANEWNQKWIRERGERRIGIETISVDLVEGDDAQASITYRFEAAPDSRNAPRDPQDEIGWTEILALKQGDYKHFRLWQIVPPDEFPASKYIWEAPLIAQAAFALAQQASAAVPNPARQSLSHLKHLGLEALIFISHWSDTFAFAPQYLREALNVHEQLAEIWTVPGTRDTYAFNRHLSGLKQTNIAQPAQTVMFYDGAEENLTFRYDGRAAVNFVDGSCRLISPQDAQNLIWKP